MAKWGYLARAYAIKEYSCLRQTEAENQDARPDEVADSLSEVIEDVKCVLEMAEDNFSSWADTPEEGRTIRQCKKFLTDFAKA